MRHAIKPRTRENIDDAEKNVKAITDRRVCLTNGAPKLKVVTVQID
jgi:hypothetical protein